MIISSMKMLNCLDKKCAVNARSRRALEGTFRRLLPLKSCFHGLMTKKKNLKLPVKANLKR